MYNVWILPTFITNVSLVHALSIVSKVTSKAGIITRLVEFYVLYC